MAEPKTVVQAGAVGSFLNWLGKTASRGLSDSMNNLIKMGIEVENAKKAEENGGFLFLARGGNNHVVKVKCIPLIDREGRYDVFVKNKGGELVDGEKAQSVTKEYHDIPDTKFDDCITDFFDKVLHEGLEEGYEDAKWQSEDFDVNKSQDNNQSNEGEEPVQTSRTLKLKLQKVIGSKKPRAKVLQVYANYDPTQALQDVRYLCTEPDFVGTLADKPEQFDVIVEDNGDFTLSDDFTTIDPLSGYTEIISCAYHTLFTMQYIHWNVVSTLFTEVHHMTDGYIDFLRHCIDTLAEIYLENSSTISHPLSLIGSVDSLDSILSGNIDGVEGAQMASSCLKMFAECLELYYPNFPHNVQSLFDEWLRFLRKESQFLLDRMSACND